MKLGLLTSGSALATVAVAALVAGCQHPQSTPAATATPPVGTTTAPSLHTALLDEHVWRFDFVLTTKDDVENTIKPTEFTLNVQEHRNGEIMVGRNVPLHTFPPDKIAAGNALGAIASPPRQDVGLKVKVHVDPVTKAEAVLLDTDLELSAVESGAPTSSIRKVTSHVTVAMGPGAPVIVTNLNDDGRHYELKATATKIR